MPGVSFIRTPQTVMPVTNGTAVFGAPAVAAAGESQEGVVLQLGTPGPSQPRAYGPDGRQAERLGQQIAESKRMAEKQNQPCETCAQRKYQDGSGDMGVSFKAATKIAPEAAASLVRAHEQEHVSRAQTTAREKDMNVMSTVTIHTDICPECKRVYVSGGVTNTRMTSKPQNPIDAYSKQAQGIIGMLQNA